MTTVRATFLKSKDWEIDLDDQWPRFVDELEARTGVAIPRVKELDAVPHDGFVLACTTHPEILLDAMCSEERAKLASRLIPLGLSRGSGKTLQMLELLALPAAINGRPADIRDRLTVRGLGLHGRRDVGEAIGAALKLGATTNYGFLEREPHDLVALLADYLTAYDARSRATVGDTGR